MNKHKVMRALIKSPTLPPDDHGRLPGGKGILQKKASDLRGTGTRTGEIVSQIPRKRWETTSANRLRRISELPSVDWVRE